MAQTTSINERIMANCLSAARNILVDFVTRGNEPTLDQIIAIAVELYRKSKGSNG